MVRRFMLRGGLVLWLLVFAFTPLFGQESGQIWLAGEVVHNTKSDLVLRGLLEYQEAYGSEEHWESWTINSGVDYLLIPKLVLKGELKFIHSNENDTLNRMEVTPVLGVFIDILNRGRVEIYDLLKFEWRQLYFSSPELNSGTLRIRNKLGITTALNRPLPSMDKALNLILSAEAFFVKQDNEKERYSNRIRYETGLSYRFNDQWLLNASYFRQHSRNQIDESFASTENIFRLKATYFL